MTDKIAPALTPEEWATNLSFARGGDLSVANAAVGDTAEEKHFIAALNLYKQDFGFTREDVKDLGWAMHFLVTDESDQSQRNLKAWFVSLTARIEALLPPETPDVR